MAIAQTLARLTTGIRRIFVLPMSSQFLLAASVIVHYAQASPVATCSSTLISPDAARSQRGFIEGEAQTMQHAGVVSRRDFSTLIRIQDSPSDVDASTTGSLHDHAPSHTFCESVQEITR
jgi:hypothetical protein